MNSPHLANLIRLASILALLSSAPESFSETPEVVQKKLAERVATLPVVAHYDQPYAANENPKQMLDLYLPEERSSETPLPVVVFIHGGGWINGDRKPSADRALHFVRSGNYAGVAISYRLSNEAPWPAQVHDCKAAIRWIRGNAQKFGLDSERIGVYGSSAGGHLVSLLGTSGGVAELEGELGEFDSESSRVTCVVNLCGPQDFLMPLMFESGQPVIEDPAVIGLIGGPTAENREKLIAASPVTYVGKEDVPFLHLHGTKDERVDFKHAERIHAALSGAGVSSLLVPVVDGGHGIKHPGVPSLIEKFFERHLRGAEVEIPDGPLHPSAPEP